MSLMKDNIKDEVEEWMPKDSDCIPIQNWAPQEIQVIEVGDD